MLHRNPCVPAPLASLLEKGPVKHARRVPADSCRNAPGAQTGRGIPYNGASGNNGDGKYDVVNSNNCNRAPPRVWCCELSASPLHATCFAINRLTSSCVLCSAHAPRLLPPQEWTVEHRDHLRRLRRVLQRSRWLINVSGLAHAPIRATGHAVQSL